MLRTDPEQKLTIATLNEITLIHEFNHFFPASRNLNNCMGSSGSLLPEKIENGENLGKTF